MTEWLLSGPLGRWDEGVNDWLLANRTSAWNGLAHVGSTIAMTLPIIGLATVFVLALLLMRRFRDAGFLAVALSVEVSVFLMTTLVVARPRPSVARLEPAPPTSSFPSGHVAAAIALYIALAFVLCPSIGNDGSGCRLDRRDRDPRVRRRVPRLRGHAPRDRRGGKRRARDRRADRGCSRGGKTG